MLNIERLNCDAIDVTPTTIDWSEAMGEDMEGWRAFEAFECPECKRTVVCSSLGECVCRDVLSDVVEDIDGEECEVPNTCRGEMTLEGPMMSYWYPVKLDDCEEAAKLIAHLPLCVVEFEDGDTGLALTGGGMDLSWEICEAFIVLGYWPPVHFCDLPKMSGRGKSEKDLAIIAACEESCRIQEGWTARKRERLGELRAWSKGDAA
jgi:hypothetical protein